MTQGGSCSRMWDLVTFNVLCRRRLEALLVPNQRFEVAVGMSGEEGRGPDLKLHGACS